ncbi:MAG: hypothetical protein NZ733_05595, partial [Aigarchaeota archaeon]|nr:hypothetical protein [Aigarchaeota archaeon]
MTRYRFLGWFVDGMELSTSESLSFTPRDHVTVVARYISQFLVRIETPLSVTERWYDRGTKIVIETLELIDFGNRTRLRFVKWEGDARTESPRFETTVQRPIGLRAHYVRLYHVRVDLSVLGIWEEWVDDGRELSLEHLIGRTILDFGNGTRLAVSGILDPSSDRTVTKLLVRRPIDTIVVWEKQHLVRVINGWTGAARELWWKENGIVELVTEELVEFGNGTRLSFRGWTGDLTPPHSPRAYLLVKGPTEVTARYVRQYLLTVMSEVSEHASRSWLDEGSRARLRVPAVHELSDGTRYRFIGWSGKVGSNEAEVELLMDGPVVLVSNWVREALVRVRLSPLEEVSLWRRMGSHLTLTAPQTLEYGGSVWVFDGWSDGITVLQRSLEVVSAMELEATYIEARTV